MQEILLVLLLIIGGLVMLSIWLWRRQAHAQIPENVALSHTMTQLAEQLTLLQQVIDASPDAMFVIGRDGRYRLSNPTHAATVAGTSVASLIGKTAYDLFPTQTADAFAQEDALVRRTRQIFNNEIPHISTTGGLQWHQVIKVPLLDASGEVENISAVVRDVSHSKAIQDRLNARIAQFHLLSHIDTEISSSLELSRVTMYALDMLVRLSVADAGYIAALQDDAESLAIVAVLGSYTTSTLGTLIMPDRGIVGRVISEQMPERILDVTADADYIADIACTKAMIVLPLVSQDQLVGVIRLETSRPERFTDDIYEFSQLVAARIALAVDNARLYHIVQQRLDEAQTLYDEMSRLEQLKTDMIRIASHDLKNPLAVVEGYLMLLMMDTASFDASTCDMLGEMQKATGRMNRILLDILSLEKINQRARGNFKPFELVQSVRSAYEEFEPQATAKQQRMTLNIAADADVQVNGDEIQLYEAITNLISNAIKYTPDNGIIDIQLQATTDHLTFSVRDSGYGIPLAMQARLFEPFYRAKTDETRAIDGTGLGLHLVKNIVERHGGHMLFESEHGKGSLFGFTLPMPNILL